MGNWGPKKLSNLPKVTPLVSGRAFQPLDSMIFTTMQCVLVFKIGTAHLPPLQCQAAAPMSPLPGQGPGCWLQLSQPQQDAPSVHSPPLRAQSGTCRRACLSENTRYASSRPAQKFRTSQNKDPGYPSQPRNQAHPLELMMSSARPRYWK